MEAEVILLHDRFQLAEDLFHDYNFLSSAGVFPLDVCIIAREEEVVKYI